MNQTSKKPQKKQKKTKPKPTKPTQLRCRQSVQNACNKVYRASLPRSRCNYNEKKKLTPSDKKKTIFIFFFFSFPPPPLHDLKLSLLNWEQNFLSFESPNSARRGSIPLCGVFGSVPLYIKNKKSSSQKGNFSNSPRFFWCSPPTGAGGRSLPLVPCDP